MYVSELLLLLLRSGHSTRCIDMLVGSPFFCDVFECFPLNPDRGGCGVCLCRPLNPEYGGCAIISVYFDHDQILEIIHTNNYRRCLLRYIHVDPMSFGASRLGALVHLTQNLTSTEMRV